MASDRDTRQWRLATHPLETSNLEITFSGRWCLDQRLPSPDDLAPVLKTGTSRLTFKTDLSSWDSAFLAYLSVLLKLCAAKGIEADRDGLPEGVRHLLAMAAAVPEQKITGRGGGRHNFLHRIGVAAVEFSHGAPAMLRFLGEIVFSFGRLLSGRVRLRWHDLWWEVEEVGPRALLIVSVISFLVGLILAYLGADQLRMVGAQIFIADLVAIGMVREIGALMTGIIIAGRTGSAFAAKLGTMQVNEEIDAFRTLGISPIDFLVLPRTIALMLMVPLLTLYSGFVGMLAGLLISTTIFDIGLFEYYNETISALELKHFAVGLVKGSVYGAMVAYSGCLRGMQCGRSAEAVGEAATSAVVTSILLITISASILTIIFYQLGI
ncbi:ABC transporter permease [Desulfoprunum benzoelyticum]|uniref:Phospholipid/cholesterol/gamma-HCH transport system permease protein n=1 Tax=Desulfoprunum benzoelyticum TaxID=1506996 RepID=A0A840UPN6_9BACT|nr:ABC transporter permease [Desulfoprunum benzoelyticum]MBB5346806.1 phospholipid/cholesterol/gamma-HCH transport system permease protein [Desulfoprunum benzoelyticum]MBM9531139.1 ABC transporter permease [Desulfoprunum benzoelyticum]